MKYLLPQCHISSRFHFGSVHDTPQVRWAFGEVVVHVHVSAEVFERFWWVSSDHVCISATKPEEIKGIFECSAVLIDCDKKLWHYDALGINFLQQGGPKLSSRLGWNWHWHLMHVGNKSSVTTSTHFPNLQNLTKWERSRERYIEGNLKTQNAMKDCVFVFLVFAWEVLPWSELFQHIYPWIFDPEVQLELTDAWEESELQ